MSHGCGLKTHTSLKKRLKRQEKKAHTFALALDLALDGDDAKIGHYLGQAKELLKPIHPGRLIPIEEVFKKFGLSTGDE